jgi:serine protease Do
MTHRTRLHLRILGAALMVAIGGAGTDARAQYSRRTPIVEAVSKTRAGIVAVSAQKESARGRSEKATGTGVLIDSRGYVLSNLHVVAEASRVRVTLEDGVDLEAQVVMQDADGDLAVLRMHAERPLPALPLGPGSDLMVGETVIAVGHPFGYRHTVSTGIISALGREVTMPSGAVLTNLIQTNASINPGNSGGPLLNINGELIGLNVALREGAQGIAFAINIDTVKDVLSRQLSALRIAGIEHGMVCVERVEEPTEGARDLRSAVSAASADARRALDAGRAHVIVATVARETPAAAAGLQRGDEIRRVASQAVGNRFDLERALWDHRAGERIPLTVRRHGHELNVNLTLAPPNTVVRAATVAN